MSTLSCSGLSSQCHIHFRAAYMLRNSGKSSDRICMRQICNNSVVSHRKAAVWVHLKKGANYTNSNCKTQKREYINHQ